MAKRRKRRLLPAILIILLLVVLAIVVLVLTTKPFSKLKVKTERLNVSAGTNYVSTGSGILYVASGQVIYESFTSDSNSYSTSLNQDSTNLCGYGDLMHTAYNDNAAYIIGASKLVEPGSKLVSAECSSNYLAIHTRSNDTDSLFIYDSNGTQVDIIPFDNTLIDYGFYTRNGTDRLYALTANVSAVTPVSVIYTHDPANRSTTGIITIQNQLVNDVFFTDSSVYVFGTTEIIRYDATGNNEQYRLKSYGFELLDCSVNANKVYALMRNIENPSIIRLYKFNQDEVASENVSTVRLPSGTVDCFVLNGELFAITRNSICTVGTSDEAVFDFSFDYEITGAVKVSDGTLLLTAGSVVYQADIKH